VKINLFNEDYSFRFGQTDIIKKVIRIIENEEEVKFKEINFIFCSDEYLKKLNVKFLNRNYYTDIITFPYKEKNISGDIYISVERVIENAKFFNVKFLDELNRVIVHGILHLCGYKDYTTEEKNEMTIKEDYYLNFF